MTTQPDRQPRWLTIGTEAPVLRGRPSARPGSWLHGQTTSHAALWLALRIRDLNGREAFAYMADL